MDKWMKWSIESYIKHNRTCLELILDGRGPQELEVLLQLVHHVVDAVLLCLVLCVCVRESEGEGGLSE
jgi:hypothetical protein